ncbi:hypothetical protein PtA15_1A267 [Puccinia triticina]|uniref:Uncharacterized protein n=1 Tax=Puccinia triticina TaxID=208348 RepID=A0ABY7C7H9_9BASI|nr:uncharacterized protein PtA15_1A267 [Puccinia triticina]WAQ80929.1 hypothetical protein PtA15_1A267 [Puccinia triticina]
MEARASRKAQTLLAFQIARAKLGPSDRRLLPKWVHPPRHIRRRAVQAAIAKEPQEFRATHLPANYDKGRNKDHFEGLVSDCIKEQKLILATFLKAGMTGKGLDKVPSLWSLIANIYSVFHPTFKKHGAKQIHSDKHTFII